jgi:hypothetical protein
MELKRRFSWKKSVKMLWKINVFFMENKKSHGEMFYMVCISHMEEDTISMEYTMYIPYIYYTYTVYMICI